MTDQIERSPNFNLFLAAGTLLGILEALFEMSGDVPETEPELTRFHAKLSGLTASGRRIARELHDFLHEAGDLHRLPHTWAQLECGNGGMIREPAPPLYLARSR